MYLGNNVAENLPVAFWVSKGFIGLEGTSVGHSIQVLFKAGD